MEITPHPSLGRIVIFRSRTGNYDVPAIVTATEESLAPAGVSAWLKDRSKGVPPLSGSHHVHLTVFTPGIPGQRASAEDFVVAPAAGMIGENASGCYQEWDVPEHDPLESAPGAGTWRWPERV